MSSRYSIGIKLGQRFTFPKATNMPQTVWSTAVMCPRYGGRALRVPGRAHFKKVLGVLSHDRQTWHSNTVLGGQYRKTRIFWIGRNVFELRRRKVLESATPILKKS